MTVSCDESHRHGPRPDDRETQRGVERRVDRGPEPERRAGTTRDHDLSAVEVRNTSVEAAAFGPECDLPKARRTLPLGLRGWNFSSDARLVQRHTTSAVCLVSALTVFLCARIGAGDARRWATQSAPSAANALGRSGSARDLAQPKFGGSDVSTPPGPRRSHGAAGAHRGGRARTDQNRYDRRAGVGARRGGHLVTEAHGPDRPCRRSTGGTRAAAHTGGRRESRAFVAHELGIRTVERPAKISAPTIGASPAA